MMILVTFDCNYADEFDLYGFYVDSKENYEKDVELLKNNFNGPVTRYFGTNGFILLESVDEILRCFSVKELTDEDVSTLRKLFGSKYGPSITFGSVWSPAEFIEE